MSKAPSFKPEGLSSLPVSPGPELVTVVRGLRGYDGPSHGGPGLRFHRASDGGVVPLRPRRVPTRLRRVCALFNNIKQVSRPSQRVPCHTWILLEPHPHFLYALRPARWTARLCSCTIMSESLLSRIKIKVSGLSESEDTQPEGADEGRASPEMRGQCIGV